jgi:hypothetical protein
LARVKQEAPFAHAAYAGWRCLWAVSSAGMKQRRLMAWVVSVLGISYLSIYHWQHLLDLIN